MKKLLVFGEVLFDLFEEKAEIGGAPFNVAAHFSALGGRADFVSAVGKDELGQKALDAVKSFQIDDRFVARIDSPTGYCKVTLKDGTPSYDLKNHVAYDAIPFPEEIRAEDYGALYYGSLACRNSASFKTLKRLIPLCSERFFDINIRPPYGNRETVRKLLFAATTLKISREEAGEICPYYNEEQYLHDVINAFPNIQKILFTMDKDGSLLFDARKDTILYAPKPKEKPLSTVGAGDSLSACYLYHTFKGSTPRRTLEACSTLADFVITRLGAVPSLPEELKSKIV